MRPPITAQSPVPQLTSTDRLRDNVELTLCRAAAQHKKPLLGICRGAQVLNVAFGGTLWQDHPRAVPGRPSAIIRTCGARRTVPLPDAGCRTACWRVSWGRGSTSATRFTTRRYGTLRQVLRRRHTRRTACGGGGSADALLGVQWHPENLAPGASGPCSHLTWLVDGRPGALLKRRTKPPRSFFLREKLRFFAILHARTCAL